MNCRNGVVAVLAVLVCALPGMAQWDGEAQQARESLTKLPGVVLQINYSSMDNWPDDPTEREVRASVEKRLQDAGIKLFNRRPGETDDRPTLVVSIGFMNFDIYSYSIDVSVALRQKVKVLSQPNLSLTATTWQSTQSSISAGSEKRDKLEQLVNYFVCEFQQANRGPNTPSAPCNFFDQPDRDGRAGKQARVISPIDEQLIRAVALNEVDDVKSLITKGADVNARDFADTTPITYAVRAYRPANDTTVIALLLKQGANPNANVRCRLTPLIFAVERGDAKAVELLLNHGADVNAGTPEGLTALMAASALGSPEIVSLLLNKGANKEAQTRNGETALSLAKRFRDRIAGYDRSANIPDGPDRDSILTKAAQVKHDRIVALLRSSEPANPR